VSFIVIEGLDGAGTTTQLARLTDRLTAAGRRVLATHEPTDGPIGRLIRQTLRGEPGAVDPACLPWMFAADRADHLSRRIEPTLRAGGVVLTDRYLHSSLAYQSLDLPLADVFALNRHFRVPDLTIIVDVPVAECLRRIDARGAARELFEEQDRLERIAAAYQAVIALLRDRGDPIVRVDGAQPVDQVQAAIWAHASPVLGG